METTFGFAISGDDEGMKGQENFKFANVVYSKPLLSCFEELGLVCKSGKICSCNFLFSGRMGWTADTAGDVF